MARAYSRDLRGRSVAAVDAGAAPGEVARLLGIAARTLRRWRERKRATGGVAPKPRPGRPPKLDAAQRTALAEHVAAHPDATLAERAAWLETAHGGRVSVATVGRQLAKPGLSFKQRA